MDVPARGNVLGREYKTIYNDILIKSLFENLSL